MKSQHALAWTAVAVVAVLSVSGDAKSADTAVAGLDLGRARVVDLSHPFDDKTIYWPTSPTTFEHEVLSAGMSEGGYWYESAAFCAPEHGGTHLDAPVHFAKGKWTAADIPVERLVGPAVVIDVRAKAEKDADYRLALADVEQYEKAHGRIPDAAIVVLRTGWEERYPDRKRYLGDDTPGDASNLHFPSYGAEAARFLIEERGAYALGVDTASIDYGASSDFPVHRIAGEANVVGLENLTHLSDVPARGAWIAALPMKIANGSGGPVRVVAFVAR